MEQTIKKDGKKNKLLLIIIFLFVLGVAMLSLLLIRQNTKIQLSKKILNADYEECIKTFPDNIEDIEINELDVAKLRIYLECEAVKSGDITKCDLLKEVDAKGDYLIKNLYGICVERASVFVDYGFKMLKEKNCEIPALKNNLELYNFCLGVIGNDKEACKKIKEGNGIYACLAVANRDVTICDKMAPTKEVSGCRSGYYFIVSALENDKSLIKNITNPDSYVNASLYFDDHRSCSELLNFQYKDYCATNLRN